MLPYVSYNYGNTKVYRQPSLFAPSAYIINPQQQYPYQQAPRPNTQQKPQKTP